MAELDSSSAPEGNIGSSTSEVIDIIERRVRDLGGSGFDATGRLTEPGKISFEFAGLDANAAHRVFESGVLDFREPSLTNGGEIICHMADGSEFHVVFSSVAEGVDASGHKEAQCTGTTGETGTVIWKPALGTDSAGETRQLTGAYVDGAEVRTEPGICVPACVLLEFTGEGALLFEQITTRLINYPLAFFIDDQLLWAPSVQSVISNGQTIISSLSLDDAKVLAAQLNSGPLPVPISFVSIEPSQ